MRLFLWLLCLPVTWAQRPMVIRDVTVIDPASKRVTPHSTVFLDANGRIAAGRVAGAAAVVDGTGKFLIPGLWDLHVHLWNSNNRPELYIAFGVTGVRDMGSAFDRTSALRREIEAGRQVGPHIVTSGPGVDGKKSDEAKLPVLVATNPGEARRAVDTLKATGVDFVKTFSDLAPEPYRALIERARELGVPVAGHLPMKVEIEDAIALKPVSIEHFMGMERLSEERMRAAFQAAARAGVRFTPTLSMHKRSLLLDAEALVTDPRLALVPEEWKKDWGDPRKDWAASTADYKTRAARTLRHYFELTRWAKESGVTILAGTDLGDPFTIPGATLHDELALLVEAGLTPMEALRAATSDAAAVFGNPGREADLVLLDADPLDNISNVKKIAGVWANGRYFDRQRMEEVKKQRR